MNITDVITQLIAIRGKHGDIEVSRWNSCCCYGDYEETVTEIEVIGIAGDLPVYVVIS